MKRQVSVDASVNPYVRAAVARLRADPWDPDALFTRAAFLAARGDLRSAILTLNQVAEVDPEYPGLWLFLARLYKDSGEAKLARTCLRRAGIRPGKH